MTENSNYRNIIKIMVAGALVLILGCGGLIGFTIVQSAGTFKNEEPKMEQALAKYMRAMAAKDTIEAGTHLSSGGDIKQQDLKEYVSGDDYAPFSAYQGLNITKISQLPYIPISYQVVSVSGTMAFNDGSIGAFEAVLRMEGGRWRIVRITLPKVTFDAGST